MSAPLIRAQDLEIAHPKGPVLLSGIGFELWPGEFTAVLGANGVGKSTLLRGLVGLIRLRAGTVQGERAAFVPSDVRPIPGLTVREVIGLSRLPSLGALGPRSKGDHRAVEQALEDMGIVELADRPYDQLSDGQRKKALLARGLAQEARVLVLDEPCAFLDAPQRLHLYAVLSRLARERQMAVLASSHAWEAVLAAVPSVLYLHRGSAWWGAPEDLVLDGRLEKSGRPEGVAFDPADGRFKYAHEVGAGPQVDWCRHYARKLGLTTEIRRTEKGYSAGELSASGLGALGRMIRTSRA